MDIRGGILLLKPNLPAATLLEKHVTLLPTTPVLVS